MTDSVEQPRTGPRLPRRVLTVQVDDDGAIIGQFGRAARPARLAGPHRGLTIEVISVHLKWELLTFPGGRFSPRNEKERTRYAVWALHRRAAEAPPAFDLM